MNKRSYLGEKLWIVAAILLASIQVAAAVPDLYVSEFSLSPETPSQGSHVSVRLGVYNQGTSPSGPFTVQWWPGENYQQPAFTWNVDGLVAKGGKILTCSYDGYPSWYAHLNTKAVVDSSNQVAEGNENNNVRLKAISVSKPSQPAQPPASDKKADLYVSEFSLSPMPPTQGQQVQIRIGVYNKGNKASGPFTVQWWPGENYQQPASTWHVDGLVPNGGKILTSNYNGYPSWYSQIVTKILVDSSNQVAESNEGNNAFKKTIKVLKP